MKIKILVFFLFIFGIIFVLRIPVGKSIGFLSPDNKYEVYGKPYLYTYLFSMAPGDGSSKPGKVFLYDNLTKQIIDDGEIDFISELKDIEWTENTAYFKQEKEPNILNPWILPRKIKLPYNKIIKKNNSEVVYEYNSFDKLISIGRDTIVNNKKIGVEYKTYDENGKLIFAWKVYKFNDKFSYVNYYNYNEGKLESAKKMIWNN